MKPLCKGITNSWVHCICSYQILCMICETWLEDSSANYILLISTLFQIVILFSVWSGFEISVYSTNRRWNFLQLPIFSIYEYGRNDLYLIHGWFWMIQPITAFCRNFCFLVDGKFLGDCRVWNVWNRPSLCFGSYCALSLIKKVGSCTIQEFLKCKASISFPYVSVSCCCKA